MQSVDSMLLNAFNHCGVVFGCKFFGRVNMRNVIIYHKWHSTVIIDNNLTKQTENAVHLFLPKPNKYFTQFRFIVWLKEITRLYSTISDGLL